MFDKVEDLSEALDEPLILQVIMLINEHNNLGGSCSGPSIDARAPEDVEQIR
ncbi:hypothetical protein L195_g045759, partial [Trifolium pratense]